MFRYREDRLPVAISALMTILDFIVFFSVDHVALLAAYWLFMLVPKGTLGAWSHHHQHVLTFRSTALNRLLELSHALHTGTTTNLWVLHHVLGHHVNYLDQTRDESRWRRADGTQMSMVAYSVDVALTAYYRAYRVGKSHPKHQRPFLIFAALTFAIVAFLVWLKPVSAIFLFVLPMICSLLFTAWVTYDHHAGLDTQDPYAACYNILNRRFNMITGNLGLHTAHHLRQGVHWSKLPELHRQIEHKIPKELFRETTFDFLLGGAPLEPSGAQVLDRSANES